MNFAELLDSWISEKILRAQTDLIARVAKLEMRVAELEAEDIDETLAKRLTELENQAVGIDTVRNITNEVVQAALHEGPNDYTLAERVQLLEDNAFSEYGIQEIIQTYLCNTDWNDMIGEEVTDILDARINMLNREQSPLTESRVRDLVYDVFTSDVDWDEMIGTTVDDRIDSKLDDFNDTVSDLAKEAISETEFRITVR